MPQTHRNACILSIRNFTGLILHHNVFCPSSACDINQDTTSKHQGCGQQYPGSLVHVFQHHTLNRILHLGSGKLPVIRILLEIFLNNPAHQRARRKLTPYGQPKKSKYQEDVTGYSHHTGVLVIHYSVKRDTRQPYMADTFSSKTRNLPQRSQTRLRERPRGVGGNARRRDRHSSNLIGHCISFALFASLAVKNPLPSAKKKRPVPPGTGRPTKEEKIVYWSVFSTA